MSDLKDLISIMQQQMELQRKQMEQQQKQMEQQQMQMEKQQNEHKAEIDAVLQQRETQHQAELQQRDQQHKAELDTLLSIAAKKSTEGMSTPSFAPFDSTTELWQDYWSRFCTFVAANSIPDERQAQVFLTSQSPALYKQLSNLAAQKTPKKDINSLTMKEITEFMEDQYDP